MKEKSRLKLDWYKYSFIGFVRGVYTKLRRKYFHTKKFLGKPVLDAEEGNKYIYEKLSTGTPFVVARYGASELKSISAGISDRLGVTKNALEKVAGQRVLADCAGFFPNLPQYHARYSDLICDLSKEIDVIPVWHMLMEDYVIDTYGKEAVAFMHPRGMEPWYSEKNYWTRALKGKKVLVIHPFSETIERQYKKRELLFEKPDMLPEFELYTVKAVQTVAGETDERFKDWFEALDWMYQEAVKTDFDVAIIGCGAYGFPLAAMLKKAGKQAIHMGGATQLLFGIKGSRWDSHPIISKLYNEHWVRPADNEKPKNANTVERGCYW